MTDTDLTVYAPLVRVIGETLRSTPVRLGPGGDEDLIGQLTLKVAAYMGRELGPSAGPLGAIAAERAAQVAKWGEQNHPDLSGDEGSQRESRAAFATWADNYRAINDGQFDPRDTDPRRDWTGVLLEEVYEALAESDPAKLRTELVQVAAVAVAWIEAIDRRAAKREQL